MLDSKPKIPNGRKGFPLNERKKKKLMIFTWNSHSSTSNSSSNRTVHLKTTLPSVRLLNMLLMVFLLLLLSSNCCTKFVYFVAYKRQSVIWIKRFIYSIEFSIQNWKTNTIQDETLWINFNLSQNSNDFLLLLTFQPLNNLFDYFIGFFHPQFQFQLDSLVLFHFFGGFFICQIPRNVYEHTAPHTEKRNSIHIWCHNTS